MHPTSAFFYLKEQLCHWNSNIQKLLKSDLCSEPRWHWYVQWWLRFLLIYLMSGCHKANGRCRSAKGTCPSDWNQWGDNCYKVIEKRPWSEAWDECVRIGGVMAAPNSLEENTYIRILTSGFIWINCNDLETEGKLNNCQFKSCCWSIAFEKDLARVHTWGHLLLYLIFYCRSYILLYM